MAEEATEPPVEPEVAEGKLPTSSTCPFLPMTLLWPSLFSLCGALPWSLSMRCSRPDICWQPSRSCSAPGRSSQASTTRAATLATPAATLAGQCPCSPHVDICSVARRADEIDARMLGCI